MIRSAIIISVGMAIGAGVGFSKVLCAGGECAITGTWLGGALMGGILGLAFSGPSRTTPPPPPPTDTDV